MTSTTLSRSGLFSKVAMLLTAAMAVGALGSYVGAGITSLAAVITLAVLFLGGAIAIMFLKDASPAISLPFTLGWVFVSGLFIGPAIHQYKQILGWEVVFGAYLGTSAVMCVCGAVALLTKVNFGKMERFLMFALFGLILVGIISIFVSMGSFATALYSLIGMAVFTGFFLVDFARLRDNADDNSWGAAIMITVNLYLDFVNFLLYLLRFLASIAGGKSKN
jgi:FtsH-binding integral membrane protein